MVRLREIPRTAAFAWSPGATSPWIATGTKSGAVDVDFSNETCLELWDLALDDHTQGQELRPAVTLPTDTGFHDLAWTSPNETRPRGILAGAFDDGSLGMWDVERMLENGSDGLISNNKVHSGAIKSLQFNPKISNLLATGGAKGELFISDLNHPGSPVRLGSTAARADDIDCLDWNKRVSHIMVSGSSGGFVTVWDMKTKKESLTLNNAGRKAVSAVAWDPEKPTRLITAVPLEQEPVILVWDLRNSNAPERTLRGHDSGVLSLSWCPQDNDLLLSCGKDNRTILWNPQTGMPYGDYPVVTNWTFQTRWNPHNPNLFATASFDGKLQIQTIQNTNPKTAQSSDQGQAADGEDFFSRAQTQPQSSSFSLLKAPKWLERPISASFGFGGRLISVKPAEPGKSRLSKVEITKFEVDSSVGSATESFEKAIQSGSLSDLCNIRIAEAKSEDERADWQVIKNLVSNNPREELVKYLGFNETEEAADGVAQLGLSDTKTDSLKPQLNGAARTHKRLSSMFDSSPGGDFLSELAATKGTRTNNPFEIYTGLESEADRRITRALTLGQFEKALDICLQEDRMSDAFMIAICGGDACTKKAQEAYFAKQSDGPNYLRLLASVVGKNLWDIVHNADLANWKEVMATLCTFADTKEFPDLCEALGDRLEEQAQDPSTSRRDASLCFLAGSKLEKVVAIWIQELKESEAAGAAQAIDNSAFSLHARGLQELIEKVTIFRRVVNFQDTELSKNGDWKLDALYGKYLEYADILAAHGQLSIAQKYLDLLPAKYPEADVARTRIQQATKKPTAASVTAQSAAASRQKPAPAYQPPQNIFSPVTPQLSTPYGAPAPPPPPQTKSYAPPAPSQSYLPPSGYQPSSGYQHTSSYQPPQPMRGPPPPPPQSYSTPQANPIPPPPRAFSQSPSVPPPPKATSMANWNDIPESFVKPPTSRRGTPGVSAQVVSSPFPAQSTMISQGPPPPAAPSLAQRQRDTPTIPPPPKGSAPPPRVNSPSAGPQSTYQPPALSSSNSYVQPPSMVSPPMIHSIAQPQIPRGPSPYNAPPPIAPPPNRYAPAPGLQSTAPPTRPSIAPPPQASSFATAPPPQNPYAPNRQQQHPSQLPSAQNPYTPLQTPLQSTPPPLPQPPVPTAASPPPMAPRESPPRPGTAQSDKHASPATGRKYSKGDRSHIPPDAQPIYNILSAEMQRVKARAPSSYKPQVVDTEKRLNILFDHLNNEDLLKPETVQMMRDLADALQARDYQRAGELQMEIHRDRVDECGNWMVGVKRLVAMCRSTP